MLRTLQQWLCRSVRTLPARWGRCTTLERRLVRASSRSALEDVIQPSTSRRFSWPTEKRDLERPGPAIARHLRQHHSPRGTTQPTRPRAPAGRGRCGARRAHRRHPSLSPSISLREEGVARPSPTEPSASRRRNPVEGPRSRVQFGRSMVSRSAWMPSTWSRIKMRGSCLLVDSFQPSPAQKGAAGPREDNNAVGVGLTPCRA